MKQIGFGVRRAGLIAAGTVCIVAGVVFAFGLFRGGGVSVASDAELAAVVGLLVLPGLTLGALRLDAGVRRRDGGLGEM